MVSRSMVSSIDRVHRVETVDAVVHRIHRHPSRYGRIDAKGPRVTKGCMMRRRGGDVETTRGTRETRRRDEDDDVDGVDRTRASSVEMVGRDGRPRRSTDGRFTNARRALPRIESLPFVESIESIHLGRSSRWIDSHRYSSCTHTTSIYIILYIHVYHHRSSDTATTSTSTGWIGVDWIASTRRGTI